MKLDANLISIFALAGLMFVAGSSITGSFWRRKLIKEEMKTIKAKQEELLLNIEKRYADALVHDENILKQIEGTKLILQKINNAEAITKAKKDVIDSELDDLTKAIEAEQGKIKEEKDNYTIQFKNHFK